MTGIIENSYLASCRNGRGFTLLELALAISIVGVIALSSAVLMLDGADIWKKTNNRSELVATGRNTMERVRREFRMLKDSTNVIAAGSASLQIVDSNDDNLTYTFTLGTLTRKKNAGSTYTLAANINTDSSYFRYYKKDGTAMTGASLIDAERRSIWTIEIYLVLTKGDQTLRLKYRFFPENLKHGAAV